MVQEQLVLTADPSFVDLALPELEAASTLQHVTTLDDGVLLVTIDVSLWELAERWRLDPPIFVRHICPVQATVSLRAKSGADLAILRQAVTEELLDLVDPTLPLSVQTRILADLPYKPFDVNKSIADLLVEQINVPIDVRTPHQVLSIVCAETTTAEQNRQQTTDSTQHAARSTQHATAYLGISPTVYNISDWAGGMRRFAREKEQVSRAEFKLLEALEVFLIDLKPRGVALDLGASPGGWTRVLRQHEQYVTAVDPGDLDPRVAADAGVRHKRMTAEQYLADEPDRFDLIVNDMRMDVRDSARLMVRYASQLYRHGIAIMTLKLPEHQRHPLIDQAFTILREAYTIAGARQLFHNRSEITLYLQKLD